ncbi:MAG: hypothetical protein Q4F53_08875, partial [Nesterenkonia sp.]|nr:hypothetical protein [Nesterenkonia sp.]
MSAEERIPPVDGVAVRLTTGGGHLTLDFPDTCEARIVRRMWSRCLTETSVDLNDSPVVDAPLSPYGSRAPSTREHEEIADSATTAAITAGRGMRLMFHAAGLSDVTTGRTAALIAPSGTGKTTICAMLGPHFGYVTDETVIVDPTTLAVTPFPKPLSVLGPTGRRPKTLRSPDELGLLHPPEDSALHAMVLLARNPHHAGPPLLETLSLSEGLQEILPQTSSVSALDRGLTQLCTTIDRVGGLRRLHYAEAESVLDLVSELLTEDPQDDAPPKWKPVPT